MKTVSGLLFLARLAPQEAAAGQLCPSSPTERPHARLEEGGGARKGWRSGTDSQSSGCALLYLQTKAREDSA